MEGCTCLIPGNLKTHLGIERYCVVAEDRRARLGGAVALLIRAQTRLSRGVKGVFVTGVTVTVLVNSIATASAQNIFEALFAVEGVALGSNIKADSSAYREYKCGPSDQFDGFTWCQRSRRDTNRQGSLNATYSVLHSKDGTIVYANRTQQRAILQASQADREIQNYSRNLGQAKITKIPRRTGISDALMATWGQIELEPLDNESIRLLAGGKSPKKGLLIDFLGDFTRSAQEGAPIYRIVGGAGFIWAGSFDKKSRGTLRIAAVDASALQPGPVAVQVSNASQSDDQQPRGDDQRSGQDQPVQPQVRMSTIGSNDGEAIIARLQIELAAAIEAKDEADRARTDAEEAAQEARTDAEVARRELEAVRNDADLAKGEIKKSTVVDGPSKSYVAEIILIGSFLVVLSLIRLLSRLSAAALEAKDVQSPDLGDELHQENVQGAVVALSAAGSTETETRSIDQDEIISKLAETLGVQRPVVPLSPIGLAGTDLCQCSNRQEQDPEHDLARAGDGELTNEDDIEKSISIAPNTPDAAKTKELELA